MTDLEKNIITLFGAVGKNWLDQLPHKVITLAKKWELSDIIPVDNMTWNFVAKARSTSHGAVVLKISCDEELIQDEIKTLRYFNGQGMIRLLEYDKIDTALLLEQAYPGQSLRSIYPADIDLSMNAYCRVINDLQKTSGAVSEKFKSVEDWLMVFDRISTSDKLLGKSINHAASLGKALLKSSVRKYVLHGDLHHDNVLSFGSSWVAIDPKGIIGEIEFEAAGFDFIHESELSNKDIPGLLSQRTESLAKKLQIDPYRLRNWVFIRLVLAACWMIEDGGDPGAFLNLALVSFPDD